MEVEKKDPYWLVGSAQSIGGDDVGKWPRKLKSVIDNVLPVWLRVEK